MSVEHPTCPYCDEPLERTVENGIAGTKPCTNSNVLGKSLTSNTSIQRVTKKENK